MARTHQAWHAERFGFANVSFFEGDIERLGDLPLAEASFGVIVSNCVINLVTDKTGVFRSAHRLPKPGGEMYFSDVYAFRLDLPQAEIAIGVPAYRSAEDVALRAFLALPFRRQRRDWEPPGSAIGS